MMENESKRRPEISPDMTILDIVSQYRSTEIVFKRYDDVAGVCLCCQALFDPLKDVADKYDLDLELLMADLMAAASGKACNAL